MRSFSTFLSTLRVTKITRRSPGCTTVSPVAISTRFVFDHRRHQRALGQVHLAERLAHHLAGLLGLHLDDLGVLVLERGHVQDLARPEVAQYGSHRRETGAHHQIQAQGADQGHVAQMGHPGDGAARAHLASQQGDENVVFFIVGHRRENVGRAHVLLFQQAHVGAVAVEDGDVLQLVHQPLRSGLRSFR